jgi:hypothetical protein
VSILVVHLVPEGLLFAADRNVTTSRSDGRIERVGQTQKPKVLRWPNRDLIVGYVGEAAVGDLGTDDWLYAFIGRHLRDDEMLADLAAALRDDLDAAQQAGEVDGVLVVHLGGFERVDGDWTPRIWYVHNSAGLTDEGAYLLGDKFNASEEIAKPDYFGSKSGTEIRTEVVQRVQAWNPFSFRQGYDLGAFNTFDLVLRAGMKAIVETHPLKLHPFPQDLREWSKHVRFAVLAYGAYFAAFYEPFEQYVGGGADVVSVPWPD